MPSGSPAIRLMRAIVGREGMDRPAASTSQMGRFETEWLASEPNLAALVGLRAAWIDRVHGAPAAGLAITPRHGQLGEPDLR